MEYLNNTFVKNVLKNAGVDENKTKLILKKLKGKLLYFRTKPSEIELIKKEYKKLKDSNYLRNDIINILATQFNKDKTTIRRIIPLQKGLFDEL